ncbi:MAG: hypothetical protein Q4E05_01195 [Pseudoclavibacter sp.]|nr:hypothetical protein [Pseudoclavibacter sp.]
MSGTVLPVAEQLQEFYGLECGRIERRLPSARTDEEERVHASRRDRAGRQGAPGHARRCLAEAQRIAEGLRLDRHRAAQDDGLVLARQREFVLRRRERVLGSAEEAAALLAEHASAEAAAPARDPGTAQAVRRIVLFCLDEEWSQHLAAAQELRDGVHLQALAGRRPLDAFRDGVQAMFHGSDAQPGLVAGPASAEPGFLTRVGRPGRRGTARRTGRRTRPGRTPAAPPLGHLELHGARRPLRRCGRPGGAGPRPHAQTPQRRLSRWITDGAPSVAPGVRAAPGGFERLQQGDQLGGERVRVGAGAGGDQVGLQIGLARLAAERAHSRQELLPGLAQPGVGADVHGPGDLAAGRLAGDDLDPVELDRPVQRGQQGDAGLHGHLALQLGLVPAVGGGDRGEGRRVHGRPQGAEGLVEEGDHPLDGDALRADHRGGQRLAGDDLGTADGGLGHDDSSVGAAGGTSMDHRTADREPRPRRPERPEPTRAQKRGQASREPRPRRPGARPERARSPRSRTGLPSDRAASMAILPSLKTKNSRAELA